METLDPRVPDPSELENPFEKNSKSAGQPTMKFCAWEILKDYPQGLTVKAVVDEMASRGLREFKGKANPTGQVSGDMSRDTVNFFHYKNSNIWTITPFVPPELLAEGSSHDRRRGSKLKKGHEVSSGKRKQKPKPASPADSSDSPDVTPEKPSQHQLVGLRCKVWWDGEGTYFTGKFSSYDQQKDTYTVEYEDGDADMSLRLIDYDVRNWPKQTSFVIVKKSYEEETGRGREGTSDSEPPDGSEDDDVPFGSLARKRAKAADLPHTLDSDYSPESQQNEEDSTFLAGTRSRPKRTSTLKETGLDTAPSDSLRRSKRLRAADHVGDESDERVKRRKSAREGPEAVDRLDSSACLAATLDDPNLDDTPFLEPESGNTTANPSTGGKSTRGNKPLPEAESLGEDLLIDTSLHTTPSLAGKLLHHRKASETRLRRKSSLAQVDTTPFADNDFADNDYDLDEPLLIEGPVLGGGPSWKLQPRFFPSDVPSSENQTETQDSMAVLRTRYSSWPYPYLCPPTPPEVGDKA